jgi:hypothetical protein
VNDVIQNTVPGGRIVEGVRKSNASQAPSQKATVVEDPLAELSQKPTNTPSVKAEALPEISNELEGLDDLDDANFDDDLYNDL